LLTTARTHADDLTITSSPPGATVEIDGLVAGTTPYKTDYPGGYFHKTHTAFSARLEHSMTVRLSKDGYLPQQITLTNGPFEWEAITGRRRGNYFLLKSSHFEIKLDPISVGNSRPPETIGREGPMRPPAPGAGAAFRPDEGKATSDIGSVAIGSDPPGADIYVDGKFVGQTPSNVQLPSGLHHIEMKAQGRQAWERDMEVLKDSQLTLHGVLIAQP
jgi:hypothetical protein